MYSSISFFLYSLAKPLYPPDLMSANIPSKPLCMWSDLCNLEISIASECSVSHSVRHFWVCPFVRWRLHPPVLQPLVEHLSYLSYRASSASKAFLVHSSQGSRLFRVTKGIPSYASRPCGTTTTRTEIHVRNHSGKGSITGRMLSKRRFCRARHPSRAM